MDGDLVGVILKDFGPAGGLAILLLAASVWANWKLILRINKMHDTSVALETTHSQEIGACRLDCERDKSQYRESLEKRYQEQVATFLSRDDQKRQDITVMFARFENLMGVITEALTKLTEASVNMKFQIRDGQGHRKA